MEKVDNAETVATETKETVAEAPPETQEQINWKKFREQREIERKQKEASDKRAEEKEAEANALKAAMEAILNKPQPQQTNHDDTEISEDQKLEQKINHALTLREKQYAEQRSKQEQAALPEKLSGAYSDFNQVCSTENLDYLEFNYPEVAKAFQNLPDNFDKWSGIYNSLKRLIPNAKDNKDRSKAEKNLNKPQSISSGLTQTGDVTPSRVLDDKKKAENWKRMQRIRNGV